MAVLPPDIICESEGMETADFLRYLVCEKFPGKVLITASLRARSIATLRMIADIASSTPVVFCHMKNVFPESLEYRSMIVDELGLTDVRAPELDAGSLPGDCYHSEALWAEDPIDGSRTYTTILLNQTLKNFDCWISAVYHGPYSDEPRPMVMEEGRLIRVDPLPGWPMDKVRGYLNERGLPFHPKTMQRVHQPIVPAPVVPGDGYHY